MRVPWRVALFSTLAAISLAAAITLVIRVALYVPAGWAGVAIFGSGAIALLVYALGRVTSAVCPSCRESTLRFSGDGEGCLALCGKCSHWSAVAGDMAQPLHPRAVGPRHAFLFPLFSNTDIPAEICAECGAPATQTVEIRGGNDLFNAGGKFMAMGGWKATVNLAHCSGHSNGGAIKKHRESPVLCVTSYAFFRELVERNPKYKAIARLKPR